MRSTRRAFTLIELLVTVGIIFLLASLIIVSLRGVRAAANRTESMSALRHMALGYASYATDNNGNFMPGAIAEEDFEAGRLFEEMTVEVTDGLRLESTDNAAKGAYIWRLAPYLDFNWKTYFVDYRNRKILSALAEEYISGQYTHTGPDSLGIAFVPSIGMNSIFIGGDNVHGGSEVTGRNPWNPVEPADVLPSATRLSEVKNPARVILFAPSIQWAEEDPNASEDDRPIQRPEMKTIAFGSTEIRPPMLEYENGEADDIQWEFRTDLPESRNIVSVAAGATFDADGGWPTARWGKDILPTAHIDGSVDTQHRLDLALDNRKWMPKSSGY